MFSTALIDGDMLLYLAGFSAQRDVYNVVVDGKHFDTAYSVGEAGNLQVQAMKLYRCDKDSVEVVKDVEVFPLSTATHVVDDVLTSTMRNTACSGMSVFLSGPNELCFRSDVATIRPYKGNRKNARRPVHYAALKAYLIAKYNASICYWHEADDALSMLADGNVMCTADKDLLQVPGILYNFFTHEHEEVSYLEGQYNLFHQILTGDAVDNIQGLKGIGATRAANALEEVKDDPQGMYDVCKEMYIERWPKDHELTGEEAFNETASLVYLLRSYEDSWEKHSQQYIK